MLSEILTRNQIQVLSLSTALKTTRVLRVPDQSVKLANNCLTINYSATDNSETTGDTMRGLFTHAHRPSPSISQTQGNLAELQ